MKLVSHLSARNMFVFDEKNNITKMESPEEIIYRLWIIRSEYYNRSKINKQTKLSEERDL